MSLQSKLEELRALGRPVMVWATQKAIATWRAELDAWRATHPGGEERYCELLAEIEALEKARPARATLWAERAGIGDRLVEAVANLRDSQAVATVRRWQTSGKCWCVLMGSTGTGKSVAAALALRDAFAAGESVAWVQSADFARVAGGFDGLAARLAAVDVLAVDDFGTEHLSDFAMSVLFGVLSARHEAKRRTVLTTNLRGQAFAARLGERLADRIRGECVTADLVGASLRDVKREGGAA